MSCGRRVHFSFIFLDKKTLLFFYGKIFYFDPFTWFTVLSSIDPCPALLAFCPLSRMTLKAIDVDEPWWTALLCPGPRWSPLTPIVCCRMTNCTSITSSSFNGKGYMWFESLCFYWRWAIGEWCSGPHLWPHSQHAFRWPIECTSICTTAPSSGW